MTTRNIVPRTTEEGQLGTTSKKWSKGYFKELFMGSTPAKCSVEGHTHDATVITQTASYRFVTDTEKSTWNGKAAGTHTHTLSGISDLDAWIPLTGWTRTDDATFTHASYFQPMQALRYRVEAGAWKYGVILGRASTSPYTYTIVGEPLVSTVTEIDVDWICSKTRMLYFYSPGAFAPSANTSPILSDQRGGTTWLETPIFPRFMRARCKTAYGGATPYVNIKIGSNFIFGDNSGNGIAVAASDWSSTGTLITHTGALYYSAASPILMLQITAAGGGTAGSDMWVEVACVKV